MSSSSSVATPAFLRPRGSDTAAEAAPADGAFSRPEAGLGSRVPDPFLSRAPTIPHQVYRARQLHPPCTWGNSRLERVVGGGL